MGRSFAITSLTNTVELNGEKTGEVTLTVTNKGGRALRGMARIIPIDATRAEWMTICDGEPERASQDTTETQPRRERPERRTTPARPRRVVLQIAPEAQTYVCIDTGEGTEIRFEGILEAPQTFRGRRLRVNLGNTSVEVTANKKRVDVGSGADPVGFEFTPRRTTLLPSGQRPCA